MFLILVLIVIIIVVLLLKFNPIKLNFLSYNLSTFLYGRASTQLNLENFKTYNDYLKSLKYKNKKNLKKETKPLENIEIRKGEFSFKKYVNYLSQFLKEKYDTKTKYYFNLIISSLLLLTNKLNYWEYFNKETNEFLGWSSYFIYNNTYYDFIACPLKINSTLIAISSIKHCIKEKIPVINFGPSNLKFKMQKFNAEIVEYH